MTSEWRKIPQAVRPYDAFARPVYVEKGCDHHGPYCKCDTPYWLRESSPIEKRREGIDVSMATQRPDVQGR